MQSARFLAANLLRTQQPLLRPSVSGTSALRQQAIRSFRTTNVKRSPVPKEEQAAHTISQRLRGIRKVPPELIPLGIVLATAVLAGVFSLGRSLFRDKTLRLHRRGTDGSI
ncbi:hypothetical protein M433DRAFT_81912 [Acidomyces richmondensis BFW]|nr:MAG: hypothetical protein FE78DRAFT_190538 [Acidomyces sp. 'richmondensis']KYG49565.1 hypothetical protein M433DRAFT_81912 [Acidomyces richmondensis BFW]